MFDPLRHLLDLWTPRAMAARPAIFAAQVRALALGARTGIPFALAVGVFTVWGMWREVSHPTLLGWFATLLVVVGLRAWLFARLPRAMAVDPVQTLHTYRVLALGIWASAAVWGAAGVVLFVPQDVQAHLLLALMLAGVCSGAAGTVGVYLPLAISFILGTLLPLMTMLALESDDDRDSFHLASLALLFAAGMTLVARNAARGVIDNEELRDRSETDAAALAGERNRFFAMFEALPDPLTVLDAERRIVHVNRAFETTFGWDAGDAIGRVPDFVLPDPQSWIEIGRVLRQGVLAGAQTPLELTFRARDGRAIECEVSVRRVSDLAGGPPLYLVRAHDITERKRVARMKDRFISTVSHELRTPLTALAGSIRLLGHLGPGSPKGAELVAIAERNSDRLLALVNDVLDLNRMTSGRLMLELRPADVAGMVADALRSIEPFAHELKVPLESAVPQGLNVRVDPHRFEQVLINLISNAVKFSPEGVPVVITGERFEQRVRVTVHDRGPGIPLEHQQSVWETFVQVHTTENRRQGGSGLGLTIAKTLTEQMGGAIGLESTVGVGTRFWIEFDAARPGDEA